jgi:hypothetical protein
VGEVGEVLLDPRENRIRHFLKNSLGIGFDFKCANLNQENGA